MADQHQDVQEVTAARVGALLALQVARLLEPEKTKWTRQELITTLYDRGLTGREINLALGISRQIIDPILSRHRKTKEKRPAATTAVATVESGE